MERTKKKTIENCWLWSYAFLLFFFLVLQTGTKITTTATEQIIMRFEEKGINMSIKTTEDLIFSQCVFFFHWEVHFRLFILFLLTLFRFQSGIMMFSLLKSAQSASMKWVLKRTKTQIDPQTQTINSFGNEDGGKEEQKPQTRLSSRCVYASLY